MNLLNQSLQQVKASNFPQNKNKIDNVSIDYPTFELINRKWNIKFYEKPIKDT